MISFAFEHAFIYILSVQAFFWHVYLCAMYVQWPWRLEVDVESFGTVATIECK